jgi:putative polyhydroxyalkanoate system protein
MSLRSLVLEKCAVSRTLTPCFSPAKGERAVNGFLGYAAYMADIRVERAHAIGKEAALAAALRVAERMKDKAQVEYRVVGDVIDFERSGAKGRLTVEPNRVIAEITLSFLLKPMRGLIESKIEEYFRRYFV